MFNPQRIAAAEYALDIAQAGVANSQFGQFVHNPGVQRVHASGHFFTNCYPAAAADFFTYLEAQYDTLGIASRWVCGYDLETFLALLPEAMRKGYQYQAYWALRKARESAVSGNPALRVTASPPGQNKSVYTIRREGGEEGESINYYRGKLVAVGGLEVVAYLNDDPVATTDFYIYDGIAHCSQIVIRSNYRRLGIDASLLQILLRQPPVQSSECTLICSPENGPIALYERLGFVRNNFMWNLSYTPPAEG